MNDCTIIILGATGDLAKRKILPALYSLHKAKKLERYCIVGAALDESSAQAMAQAAREHSDGVDDASWGDFERFLYYKKANFLVPEDFSALVTFVLDLEKQHNFVGNRLIYCATQSDFFCAITTYCAQTGLIVKKSKEDSPWHRIVYEKPFGKDLDSAQEINSCIANFFHESQIYRIDHYLTKELVGNIALVRFSNCIFEPLWSNRYIDHVQIILSETVGVEDRGLYYDNYGVLRDMVQNHMLEMLALIAMEAPWQLSGEPIRAERAAVLERVRVVDGILGQYRSYHSENNVRSDSETETFAALMMMVDNPRWTGVPFYFKTGKFLDKKETVITIKFKQVDCLLAKRCDYESNSLTIRVTPDASFLLNLNAKKPGVSNETVPIRMDFCHSCLFGPLTPEAYELLLEEVMHGEHSVSVRFDEIESAWRIIDNAYNMHLPLYTYEKGSEGPKELEQFARKHGMRWLS